MLGIQWKTNKRSSCKNGEKSMNRNRPRNFRDDDIHSQVLILLL